MPTKTRKSRNKHSLAVRALPADYASVLAEMKQLVSDARRRSLAAVNSELVLLYWSIGRTIVSQQEKHSWGDGVVERLSADLRAAFPDMKGLSTSNLWKSRHFYRMYRNLADWQKASILSTVSTELAAASATQILSTLSTELPPGLSNALLSLSWSHQMTICFASDNPAEQYFYLQMASREHWSLRELARQIESGLFLRYVSVARDPEKCLPEQTEQGPLLPFKDHYVLDFLGLEEQHTERQLRKAMLANVRPVPRVRA